MVSEHLILGDRWTGILACARPPTGKHVHVPTKSAECVQLVSSKAFQFVLRRVLSELNVADQLQPQFLTDVHRRSVSIEGRVPSDLERVRSLRAPRWKAVVSEAVTSLFVHSCHVLRCHQCTCLHFRRALEFQVKQCLHTCHYIGLHRLPIAYTAHIGSVAELFFPSLIHDQRLVRRKTSFSAPGRDRIYLRHGDPLLSFNRGCSAVSGNCIVNLCLLERLSLNSPNGIIVI